METKQCKCCTEACYCAGITQSLLFLIRPTLQSINEKECVFLFWDEQSLKVRCLHFLSGFVNEHRWDPTVMRQGQASGRGEIIHLTLEEAENLCSGSFKHDKFWKVFCCQSVVYGPQITLVSCQRISTLKWFEMARRGGREGNVRARRKGNRKKS